MANYKNMVGNLDEMVEADRVSLNKFKKAIKAVHGAGQTFVSNDLFYAENMEKLGSMALSREAETGIGAAFLRFSVITKELANLRKNMLNNFNNMVLFPLDSLLKGDIKSLGDLKRPIDDAWKDLKAKEAKEAKAGKEARKKTGEIVLYRVDPPESSEVTDREKKTFMFQACEYLVKANEVKMKKGVELVYHLIDFYKTQLQYFHSGMELLEDMRSYFDGLTEELQLLRTKQDEERKDLTDIKSQLKCHLQLEKPEGEKKTVYNLHGQQGDKIHGTEKSGFLSKRSEGVRKQWQKRYCVVKNGQFTYAHSTTSSPTVTLSLLTCDVKPGQDKEGKNPSFSIVANNRTYYFQADDEIDHEAWISVISNARKELFSKAFGDTSESLSHEKNSTVASNLRELTQGIVGEVQRLPGNHICVDCGTKDPDWLSTNLGILMCIECSGIHRDMGVHVSRIRSLTLDRLGSSELLLAKAVGNGGFNEIMEAELDYILKLSPTSNMDQRKEFIQAKYMHKKFAHQSGNPPNVLLQDLAQAIHSRDILAVIQLNADGVAITKPLDTKTNQTALHLSVEMEDLTSLHILDFLIQNSNNVDMATTTGNTALHLASILDKPECIKLLLRGGANSSLANKEGKTAITIAKEKKHLYIVQLFEDAAEGKLSTFENVKIDWGINQAEDIYENPLDLVDLTLLPKDELSEDDFKSKSSLPPSSPLVSSKSVKRVQSAKTPSIPTPFTPLTASPMRHSVAAPAGSKVDSFTKDVPPRPSQSPPPLPIRKTIKQRPTPNTTPLTTPSSTPLATPEGPQPPTALGLPGSNVMSFNANQTPTASVLTSFGSKSTIAASILSPTSEKSPPPPAPPTRTSSSLPRNEMPPLPKRATKHQRNASDGSALDVTFERQRPKSHQRTDSLPIAMQPDGDSKENDAPPPLPPPRPKSNSVHGDTPEKGRTPSQPPKLDVQKDGKPPKIRRAKALYDCDADHIDELSFAEGEVIIILGEADPEWWFGQIEGQPSRKGVVPISFVHLFNE